MQLRLNGEAGPNATGFGLYGYEGLNTQFRLNGEERPNAI